MIFFPNLSRHSEQRREFLKWFYRPLQGKESIFSSSGHKVSYSPQYIMGRDNQAKRSFHNMIEKISNLVFNSKGRISYSEIKEFLTPETLAVISNNPVRRNKISLLKLCRIIHPNSRFDLWKRILSNSSVLNKKALFDVWYNIYNDHGNINFQLVDTPDGEERFNAYPKNIKLLSSLALTDPLLIDNNVVKNRYTQTKKKGWEMIRVINGRRWQTLKLPDIVRDAIEKDAPERFVIAVDISAVEFSSFSFLAEIMDKRAFNIFCFLIKNGQLPGKIISMEELCAYAAAFFDDQSSLPFLRAIEEFHPGTLKTIRDEWGRNLLWYAVHNKKTGWFHPNCKLTPFLIEEAHCDPENKNHLGLSYDFITESLTCEQKLQQMRYRYAPVSYIWQSPKLVAPVSDPYSLRHTQPLTALK